MDNNLNKRQLEHIRNLEEHTKICLEQKKKKINEEKNKILSIHKGKIFFI